MVAIKHAFRVSAVNAPFFRNGVCGKPSAKALDVKLQFETQLANLLYLDAVVRSSEKLFAQPPNMVFYSTSHGPASYDTAARL